MIRTLTAFFLGAFVFALTLAPVIAKEEKEAKEETLKGEITCAKCGLKIDGQKKCATVIKVGDKVYWFDEKSDKAHHKEICTEAKEGSVTGTVKKDGDKMIITVTKLEYNK